MLTEAPLRPAPAIAEDRRPHAVVIGSGLGGLAAAVRLGARGFRVTVLERLDRPGGRARVFQRDGFTFDAGPTIITAPFLLEELWALAGRRLADDVRIVPCEPFYRIRFHDGAVFTYCGDEAAMRGEVARFSPEDVPGWERYMRLSLETCRIGFEGLGHVPFGSLADMLRVAPDLVRLRAWRSVYSVVCDHIRDARLRVVFSFHPLLIGGNPLAASSVYCLIPALEARWGVHFAIGGTGAVVRGLAGLVSDVGGTIRYRSEVARIEVNAGRVRGVQLAGGERISADIVVSNADSAFTYGRLLAHLPRRRWTDRKLARARYSNGLFVWYFGTRRRYETVGHHTIMIGPRYEEHLRDIFRRKVLAPDFSLYLHRPTAADPSLAPPGCDTFYALAPVPNLDSHVDWAREAEPFRARIARYLESTLLPGLSSEIAVSHVATPLDFERDLLSPRGAGFGLEPILTQSAWFRPHNESEEVEGLYLVGAGTHPGAGVPGVLSSARVLDTVLPDAAVFC